MLICKCWDGGMGGAEHLASIGAGEHTDRANGDVDVSIPT